ncbi:DNA primase [Hydrogenophaga crassostreae]|uniref:DNA primase n=1 Tax=Hydrogenophaga crassostreae TaxID=1763535 RepID=A0A162T0X3_9BURK|nr:DNA primase [Hydrogenophaga crassostreae]AOW15714.1 DNA primase [Hydrogenophaga crassostreae]OAD42191.1 DNA primase [Hydrogenophaga crassostreae]
MAIPQTFIQELINRVDVVDVVGRYVQLKKGGANFMGLCPFHGEKSPSFSVSPTKQFYYCFGCGAKGNAIGFLMEHAGMSFIEAVKDLAQQTGMQIPEDEASPQDRERAVQQRQKQVTLNTVLDKAAHAYIQQLKITPRAVSYLKGRGLSGEIAKTFGLGYAPEGWRALAGVFPDYADPMLVESGLVIEHADEVGADGETKRYDRFRDRIMFPIRNVKGECIGFGGRVLDKGEPKYLNSPETPVFSKGRELYGLFEGRTPIRVAGYALVTEGYMDVVALAQLGFANAVATLGTACTPDHVQKLFRFTDTVVFSFDGDGAGRRAARKALDAALPLATDTRSVKFLFLPAEHDPDSFVRANGSEAFAKAVKEAVPLSRFLIDAAGADCDLTTAEGRARMTSQARPLWSALPDGALKRQLIGELAENCGLSSQDLLQIWQQASDGPRWRRAPQPEAPPSGVEAHPPDHGTDFYEQPTTSASYTPESSAYAPTSGGSYGSGFEKKRFDKSSYGRESFGGKWRNEPPPQRMLGQRKAGGSRADRAVGLLLTNASAWQSLSADDHAMLAHLPGTPGAVFTWLEAQMHEHGPQPWAAMREALRGHEHEAFACAQAEQLVSTDESDDPEAEEIRDVMTRLRIERLKAQESEAITKAAQDPSQLQRYRELQAERKALEHRIGQGPV